MREDTEELLEGIAGERKGYIGGVRPPGGSGANGARSGNVPFGPRDDGSLPGREGEDRDRVRDVSKRSRLLRIQSHLRLR